MKRFAIIVMVLTSVTVCPALAQTKPGPKVLLIPREGRSYDLELMLTKEVNVMVGMLEKAGFEVEVATASGEPIVAETLTLKPDLKLVEVKVDEYAGFIMACMAVGILPPPPQPPEAVAIVKQAAAQEKPIAAQFGTVQILAEAGVRKGKRYAFLYDPLGARHGPRKGPRFVDAIYSGENVVQDGNIITSGVCPYIGRQQNQRDGTAELAQKLIAELKKRKNP
jgi:putative intracellular protease/amidase